MIATQKTNRVPFIQQTAHSFTDTDTLSTHAILEFALFVSIVSIYSSSPQPSLTSRFRFSMSLLRATMMHRCASKHAGAVANCSSTLNTFLPGRFCSAKPTIFSQCRIGPSVWIYASRAGASPTWKEHSSDSSTLIIAPALSNSPQ